MLGSDKKPLRSDPGFGCDQNNCVSKVFKFFISNFNTVQNIQIKFKNPKLQIVIYNHVC